MEERGSSECGGRCDGDDRYSPHGSSSIKIGQGAIPTPKAFDSPMGHVRSSVVIVLLMSNDDVAKGRKKIDKTLRGASFCRQMLGRVQKNEGGK